VSFKLFVVVVHYGIITIEYARKVFIMADYKPLGKFIISEKIKKQYFSSRIYRGIYAPEGKFDKFVFLKILNNELVGYDEFSSKVLKNVPKVQNLTNSATGKILDYGTVDDETFIVYDFEHGEFLVDIIKRCFEEGIPFAVDHIISILSGILFSLDEAHSRGIYHGFLVPHSVVVSYEGKVKLYDYASAPFLPELLKQNPEHKAQFEDYLHPLVCKTAKCTNQSDIISLGLLAVKMLTGKSILTKDGQLPDNLEEIIENLEMGQGFDAEPVPDDIKKILLKSLVETKQYKSINEFRKDIEDLVKSDKYSPTTFNLAFFVHSLFREENESSSAVIEVEKKLNYSGYLNTSRQVVREQVKHTGSKNILAAIGIIIALIIAVSFYFYSENKRIAMEKDAIAQKAKDAAKSISTVEKEMQQKIIELQKERERRIKELMEQANKEADRKIKEQMLRLKKQEEQKYADEIKQLEEQKKKIAKEKEKQLQLADNIKLQNKKNINTSKVARAESKKISNSKKNDENLTEKNNGKKVNVSESAKNKEKTVVNRNNNLLKNSGKSNKKKVATTKKENKVKKVMFKSLQPPTPFIWNNSFSQIVVDLNKLGTVSKIEMPSAKRNKMISFAGIKDNNRVGEVFADAVANGLLEVTLKEGNSGNSGTMIIDNVNTLNLKVSYIKFQKIDFNVVLVLKQNESLINKFREKSVKVDKYLLPIFVSKVEFRASDRRLVVARKSFEKFLFEQFAKGFTVVAKVKNRKTTKFILVDSSGNKFEYYFDLGNNFSGASIKMIFAKK
jgi:serine/threonine protein kinase